MKKLILALLATLALSLAAHAQIVFYYGTGTFLTLPTSGNASATPGNFILLVDYAGNTIRLILLTQTSTPGAAFDYDLGSTQALSIVSLTSQDSVSYTYLTQSSDTSSANTVVQQQYLLYGANQPVNLVANPPMGPAHLPTAITGGAFGINYSKTTTAGLAAAINVNLSILLAPTQSENQAGHTLSQAIADTKTVLDNLHGHQK